MITPQQRETIRLSLLTYIAAGEGHIATSFLVSYIRSEGFRSVDEAWIKSELQYLSDKGLIIETQKLLSPENKHWRITGTGRDFLASNE